jgi:hypothetical protein
MALKVLGLKKKSNQGKPTIGFSDNETVMIDFDNTPLEVVKNWAELAMNGFNLEGFIILKSSENSYHVVFNRPVSWSENMRIVAWLSLLSGNEKLKTYLLMQCIKESSTLRISNKGKKQSPRIVFWFGKQDKQIKEFLSYRKEIKTIIRTIQNRKQENTKAK